MNEITVFYGPLNKFEEIVPHDYTTLTTFVTSLDNSRNIFQVTAEQTVRPTDYDFGFDRNFVAFGNEFFRVKESFVMNLITQLSEHEFHSVFIHNPPAVIVEQLEKQKNEINIERHTYPSFEKSHIKRFFSDFDDRVIGQSNAKTNITLSLIPLLKSDIQKPIVLLFYGPTGVGKTEAAKFLGEITEREILRKQFSMFQTNEYSNYLYGGNVNEKSLGYDFLDRDSNIILFDEFDKVSSHFHSAFYELFDEGVFTDKNYKVEMKKTIIICTSNYQNQQQIKDHLGEAIFSRFDDIIEFKPLSLQAKKSIIERKIQEIQGHYSNLLEHLDMEEIQSIITGYIANLHNVREIEKLIHKIFSLNLLKEIMEQGND